MPRYDYIKASKAIHQRQKQQPSPLLVDPREVKPEFRILVGDLRYLLSRYKKILDQEEQEKKLEGELLNLYGDKIVSEINTAAQAMEPLCADLSPEDHFVHKAYFQEHLLEFVTFCSAFSTRAYQKPRGYAGDYVMMNMLCDDNVYVGRTLFEKCIHRFSITSPSGSLVKSRLQVISQVLEKTVLETLKKRDRVKVMDLACGPSIPIQAFLRRPEGRCLEVTFIDQDAEAIGFLRSDIQNLKDQYGGPAKVHYYNQSIRDLLSDPQQLEVLSGQDLILCSGLFDYLDDDTARLLLQVLYTLAVSLGTLLIGNISPRLTTKIFQWYVNEWPLTYRDEEELKSLAPEGCETKILSEPLGFNLFLRMTKLD